MQQNESSNRLATVTLGAFAVIAALFIILFPERAFRASLDGLGVWWKIVFPALLPYFVFVRLLTDFGTISFIARGLKPLMRALFRLPGIGGLAIASGLIAGWPAGADAVKRLMREHQLDRSDAERLLALSHSVNPVIAVHVIAVGFFGNVWLGSFLLAVHIASLWCTGIIFRKRGKKPSEHVVSSDEQLSIQMQTDAGGLGKRLGDAVFESVQTLLAIGGTIMMFSVLVEVAEIIVSQTVASLGGTSVGSEQFASGSAVLLSNALEIHWGAYQLSGLGLDAFPQPIIVCLLSALLAWGGLASHMQVQSIVRGYKLRYRSFLSFRLLHAALASAITSVAWPFAAGWLVSEGGTVSASAVLYPPPSTSVFFPVPEGWWWMAIWAAFVIIFLTALSLLCFVLTRLARS